MKSHTFRKAAQGGSLSIQQFLCQRRNKSQTFCPTPTELITDSCEIKEARSKEGDVTHSRTIVELTGKWLVS